MSSYLVCKREVGGREIIGQYRQLLPTIVPKDKYDTIRTQLFHSAVAAYIYFDAHGMQDLEIVDCATSRPVDLGTVLTAYRQIKSRRNYDLVAIAKHAFPAMKTSRMIRVKIGNSYRDVVEVAEKMTLDERAMVHRIDGKSAGGAPVFLQ